MRAADVAMTPSCTECDDVWLPADDRRWSAFRSDDPTDPNDPPALEFFCPDCAARDFGD